MTEITSIAQLQSEQEITTIQPIPCWEHAKPLWQELAKAEFIQSLEVIRDGLKNIHSDSAFLCIAIKSIYCDHMHDGQYLSKQQVADIRWVRNELIEEIELVIHPHNSIDDYCGEH